MRVTESAVEALREASESFLTSMFEDSYMLALHAKRVTLFPRDINLLLHLRKDPACS
jgi:histone H3/H4